MGKGPRSTNEKVCNYCKEKKDEKSFGRSIRFKDGLQEICKLCWQSLAAVLHPSEGGPKYIHRNREAVTKKEEENRMSHERSKMALDDQESVLL